MPNRNQSSCSHHALDVAQQFDGLGLGEVADRAAEQGHEPSSAAGDPLEVGLEVRDDGTDLELRVGIAAISRDERSAIRSDTSTGTKRRRVPSASPASIKKARLGRRTRPQLDEVARPAHTGDLPPLTFASSASSARVR